MIIKRINKNTGEVLNQYNLHVNEKIIYIENTIYIVTNEEYDKYILGQIEPFEFNDAPYELGEYLLTEEEMLVIEGSSLYE